MKVLHSKGRDTFGVGIVKDKKVISNVKDSYITSSGGIIPAKAAEHHVEVCDKVLKQALDKSKLKLKDVDLISFSQGPGIGHCLRIGAFFARTLALMLNKPLIGVNHCIAHLEIGNMLFPVKDPVLLYASGANTQVIAYEAGKYRIFGETLDIGVGNFLDAFARYLGLGFPGGPKLYSLSLKSSKFIELPYVVKGMDVSFGGLLTNLKKKYDKKFKKEDLAYSMQETAFAMLLEVAERALHHCDKKELILGGGVACNLRFQEMAKRMCKDNGFKCFIPPNEFLVDNAAMIAYLGLLEYKSGIRTKDSSIRPYERTDDVNVSWR